MRRDPPPRPQGPARLVLVVEDEVLIGLYLADVLEEGGFRVMGPAPTVAAALALLDSKRPDAAVLDASLRGRPVTPVALALHGRGMPFVLASALDREHLPHEVLRQAPQLGKPTPAAKLVATLRRLLDAGEPSQASALGL